MTQYYFMLACLCVQQCHEHQSYTPVDDGQPEAESVIVARLRKGRRPVVLALNKTDRVENSAVLEAIRNWSGRCDFAAVVPTSARHGHQVEDLVQSMAERLPPGPPYFPPDALTDLPEVDDARQYEQGRHCSPQLWKGHDTLDDPWHSQGGLDSHCVMPHSSNCHHSEPDIKYFAVSDHFA